MSDLQLTAQRRSELIELLDDDDRLRRQYPQVSEYLEVAPQLPGTGDLKVDGSFELRFIHYMTDASSSNPYWEIVSPLVTIRDGRRILDGGVPEGSARLGFAQMLLHQAFAYAVPSPETVQWVCDFAGGNKIIEIGAGRGYWAAQLSSAGADISAFDIEPPSVDSNPSFPQGEKTRQTWHDVSKRDSYRELDDYGPESVLFLCWPPGWGNPMASDSLKRFEDSGGSSLIYVGEPMGGKTANDAFFDALSAHWELESVDSQYVTWWNLQDQAQAWRRKLLAFVILRCSLSKGHPKNERVVSILGIRDVRDHDGLEVLCEEPLMNLLDKFVGRSSQPSRVLRVRHPITDGLL
jgi:hypothetical protein